MSQATILLLSVHCPAPFAGHGMRPASQEVKEHSAALHSASIRAVSYVINESPPTVERPAFVHTIVYVSLTQNSIYSEGSFQNYIGGTVS